MGMFFSSMPPAAVLRALTVVFGVLFCWYIWAAGPQTYLLDSPELIATTVGLGISHPPGHPAFHLLASPFLLWPVGNLAFRVHLACAAFTALSGALVLLCAWRAGWVHSRRGLIAAGVVALGVGGSQALLFQSVRAEVYSLNLLTTLIAWFAVCRPGPLRTRQWAVAAAALGLGLLNHHYLTLFTFPAFTARFIAGTDARHRWRALALAVLVGSTSIAGYGYLVVRGAARAMPAWIWPTDPSALLWHMSAAAFQKNTARAAQVDPVAGFSSAMELLAESLTWPWLAGAAIGLILLLRSRPSIGVPLGLLLMLNLITQILVDFDPANPDVLGYFMPAFAAVGLLVCAALTELDKRAPLKPAGHLLLGTAASLALLVAVLVPSAPGRTRSLHAYSDGDLLLRQVRQSPPDTTVITAYFETSFLWWNEQAVRDERPDLHMLHRSWRTYPHYDAMVAESDPTLPVLFNEHPEHGGLDVDALVELAGRRVVLIQP